jgi:hypothetical protein
MERSSTNSQSGDSNGISLAAIQVVSVDFKTTKNLKDGAQGVIKYVLKYHAEFSKKDDADSPDGMVQQVEADLRAWEGVRPEAGEPTAGEECMICRAQVKLYYRITTRIAQPNLEKLAWHFRAQAALSVRDCIRGILKNTPYGVIPIPTDA